LLKGFYCPAVFVFGVVNGFFVGQLICSVVLNSFTLELCGVVQLLATYIVLRPKTIGIAKVLKLV
jgi:hypothetical protein